MKKSKKTMSKIDIMIRDEGIKIGKEMNRQKNMFCNSADAYKKGYLNGLVRGKELSIMIK